MKKNILFFILGLIVMSGISAVAYSYTAKQVGFTPTDKSWKVSNVEEAINDLKNNSTKTAVEVATLTTQGATYTMQNDGYIIGTSSRFNDAYAALVYLNDIPIVTAPGDSIHTYQVSIYASKGTIVATRSDYGEYNLTVYEWK